MSGHSLKQSLYWDAKAEWFEVDTREIRANARIMDIGDSVDPDTMKNCPTWLEYVVLNSVKPENQVPVDLYKAYGIEFVQSLCTGKAQLFAQQVVRPGWLMSPITHALYSI
jgi:hypothetical protein